MCPCRCRLLAAEGRPEQAQEIMNSKQRMKWQDGSIRAAIVEAWVKSGELKRARELLAEAPDDNNLKSMDALNKAVLATGDLDSAVTLLAEFHSNHGAMRFMEAFFHAAIESDERLPRRQWLRKGLAFAGEQEWMYAVTEEVGAELLEEDVCPVVLEAHQAGAIKPEHLSEMLMQWHQVDRLGSKAFQQLLRSWICHGVGSGGELVECVSALLCSHLEAGELEEAEQIIQLCPELGLPTQVISSPE